MGGSRKGPPISTIKVFTMTTKDILQLNFKDPESFDIMQKALKKVTPIAKLKCDVVKLEKLEKLLFLFQKRYFVRVMWIFVSYENDQPVYTLSLENSFTHTSFARVHGITLYEVMSKAVIATWSQIKTGKIKNRKDTK